MLALAVLDADTCPGCRGRLSQTTALDPWGQHTHRYEVQPPHQCARCTALAEAQKKRSGPGLFFSATDTVLPTRQAVTDG